MPSKSENHLEPRVSKIEGQIVSLAKDISDLTSVVRDLARNTSSEIHDLGKNTSDDIQKLMVAVTSAAGPRQTNWAVLVACGALAMAIGHAAISPVYLRSDQNIKATDELHSALAAHLAIDMHPVGAAKMLTVETLLKDRTQENTQNIASLDAKLQREVSLMLETKKDEMTALRKDFEDVSNNGSGITRERLAVLEDRLATMKGKQ